MGRVNRRLRRVINCIHRLRLRNKSFSLFSNNCTGCMILHELGLRFNSPFVNLWIGADDYLKFLKAPEHYLNCEMEFEEGEGTAYPIGVLDDIRLHLVHYKTPEEAARKWKERAGRVDMENLFVMFSDRDGCTMEHLRAFDALPYRNKVVFTHVPHPEIRSACYIKGFEDQPCVGELYLFRGRWSGRKFYDGFNYVSWFNRGRRKF